MRSLQFTQINPSYATYGSHGSCLSFSEISVRSLFEVCYVTYMLVVFTMNDCSSKSPIHISDQGHDLSHVKSGITLPVQLGIYAGGLVGDCAGPGLHWVSSSRMFKGLPKCLALIFQYQSVSSLKC